MNETMLYAIVSLSGIGGFAAIILYFIAQKFKVIEDPRIDEVNERLPGANCGGCGFAGCRNFAEEIIRRGDLTNLSCPVGGNSMMGDIASFLGLHAEIKEPQVAVSRCNGCYENAPQKVRYQGADSCAFAHSLSAGESGCPNGCLHLGDCVAACMFDAMYMDEQTGLPVIIDSKCVACGACVTACPRDIIELRNKGRKDRRIYVCCVNTEKGGPARKNCSVACIGCGKCVQECKFEAIILKNNLAYIDYTKCTLCRKCVPVCPTNAIHELNFPPRKDKTPLEKNVQTLSV